MGLSELRVNILITKKLHQLTLNGILKGNKKHIMLILFFKTLTDINWASATYILLRFNHFIFKKEFFPSLLNTNTENPSNCKQ